MLLLSRGGDPEMSTFTLVLAGGFIVAAAVNAALFVRQLRRPALLPEGATVLQWPAAGVRVVAWGLVPLGVILYGAASPDRATWVLGFGCVLLGACTCVAAAVLARAERRRGIRMFRVDNRYALFVTR